MPSLSSPLQPACRDRDMGLRADAVTSSPSNNATTQPDVEVLEADIPGAWHDHTGGRPETGTE
ncbi:hypothetical protein FRC11_007725, partial [Ceratobasidium sp. 423]